MTNEDSRKNWVISFKRIPTHPLKPLFPMLVLFVFLERFDLPEWFWGVFFALWALVQMSALMMFIKEKRKEVLFEEEPDDQGSPYQRSWQRSKMQ